MKIVISILNYVDTIDVLINGQKTAVKKLSFFSKAEFQSELEAGIHNITIIKRSAVTEKDWTKRVFFDWLSCLSGLADWTLSEKDLDKKTFSISLKINFQKESHISFKLTENGFKIIDGSDNGIFDIVNQTETSKTAKKRINILYIIPVYILTAIIGICLLTLGIFLIIYKRYFISIVPFALTAFWAWLILHLNSKGKKNK